MLIIINAQEVMLMRQLWKYAVVGNIKKSRVDVNGVLRYGTSAFKGNSKVYLCGRMWDERISEGNKKEISVLGLCRGKRYYVDSVAVDWIENVRLTRVYKPTIIKIMSNWEFADGWWGNTQEERADALKFVESWNELYK